MGLNSVSYIPPSANDIAITNNRKQLPVENKNIKNLYRYQSKADMLSVYMNRMNKFYASVKDVIDQKNPNIAGRGFKYEVQHGLEIHKTPDAGL